LNLTLLLIKNGQTKKLKILTEHCNWKKKSNVLCTLTAVHSDLKYASQFIIGKTIDTFGNLTYAYGDLAEVVLLILVCCTNT
jgi:hypothetical protein